MDYPPQRVHVWIPVFRLCKKLIVAGDAEKEEIAETREMIMLQWCMLQKLGWIVLEWFENGVG